MASSEILRYIDSIARDKEIDKEALIVAVEQAVGAALARKYGIEDLELTLDRDSGQWVCNYELALEEQGRIMAQAVKQAIITKVREAERDVLFGEYESKVGEIVTGTVQRFDGATVIINLGRAMDGILPAAEKVRSENYNIGDRIRALVLEVKKTGPRVKVILSRAHRDLVRCLFELEVPEIADNTIMIRKIEREPGYRTKLAVHSTDTKVDCVGACVGVRGTRIKSIIDELNGERIDIIRWNDDNETMITNALKPAEIAHIELDPTSKKALVLVTEENLSLAIGRKGQNVRLASKLTGWEIDIMTRAELEKQVLEEDKPPAAEPGEGGAGIEGAGPNPAAPPAENSPTQAGPEVVGAARLNPESGAVSSGAVSSGTVSSGTVSSGTVPPSQVAGSKSAGSEPQAGSAF